MRPIYPVPSHSSVKLQQQPQVFFFPRASLSAEVGQVTETDTAQAVTWAPKHRLVNQVVETDTAQAITVNPQRRLLGQSLETDTAQAIARVKTLLAAQVSETDSSQAVARLKTKALAQTSEADSAQAIASLKLKALGQSFETDTAQAIGRQKTRALGQATETDLAQSITRTGAIIVQVGQAAEVDSAASIAVIVSGAAHVMSGTARRVSLRFLAQRAEIKALEEQDEFGELSATHGPAPDFDRAAAVAALCEADEWTESAARSEYRAGMRLLRTELETATLTARRGLPSKAILEWWMREAA